MTNKDPRFFLVREDILPEAIIKTAQAKELLSRGRATTVNEAVEKVGLSRSAFYKYKEGIFPFHQWSRGSIVTISLLLEHRSGVLSSILNNIAQVDGNVLTINQNVPLEGVAGVTVAIETAELRGDLEELVARLQNIDGVRRVELVGQS
ncbi:ACT domain-containing protein [Desulfofalx alkaliphila]|uniref:ACT domain-containing protein n=1 Tax=Desulfofalx alkaliphila TaxID=105483 RepID=UPI0004E0C21E|nr:ACT domain-containing protein [Desulfofalx alkaliphila]